MRWLLASVLVIVCECAALAAPAAVYAARRQGVCGVSCGYLSGSGTFLSSTEVLTSYFAVAPELPVTVSWLDATGTLRQAKATRKVVNARQNLALLELPNGPEIAQCALAAEVPPAGASLVILGRAGEPQPMPADITQTVVGPPVPAVLAANLSTVQAQEIGEHLIVSALFPMAMEGAGVFDGDGRLLAVASHAKPGAEGLLTSHRVPVTALKPDADATWLTPYAEAAPRFDEQAVGMIQHQMWAAGYLQARRRLALNPKDRAACYQIGQSLGEVAENPYASLAGDYEAPLAADKKTPRVRPRSLAWENEVEPGAARPMRAQYPPQFFAELRAAQQPLQAGEKRRLPFRVRRAALGYGGRYLFVQFVEEPLLAVFDLADRKLLRYLPLTGENATFAAGAQSVVLWQEEAGRLEAYALPDCRRYGDWAQPVPGVVHDVAMGAVGYDVVAMHWSLRHGKQHYVTHACTIFDLQQGVAIGDSLAQPEQRDSSFQSLVSQREKAATLRINQFGTHGALWLNNKGVGRWQLHDNRVSWAGIDSPAALISPKRVVGTDFSLSRRRGKGVWLLPGTGPKPGHLGWGERDALATWPLPHGPTAETLLGSGPANLFVQIDHEAPSLTFLPLLETPIRYAKPGERLLFTGPDGAVPKLTMPTELQLDADGSLTIPAGWQPQTLTLTLSAGEQSWRQHLVVY